MSLNSLNFASVFPSTKRSFVMFYNYTCGHCKSFSALFDQAITNASPQTNFYRIDGSANPELQNRFSEIVGYPSIAYFEPYSMNISSVYTGKLDIQEFLKWINTPLSDSYKDNVNDEFYLALCENYKQTKEGVEELKTELEDIKNAIEKLKEENVRVSYDVNKVKRNMLKSENISSWLWKTTVLISGTIIGYLGWKLLMRETEKIKLSV